MKRFRHPAKGILLMIFVAWFLCAQTCNKMRVDDSTAIQDFKKSGIVLTPFTENINGHHLHYVSTGADSLPLLVFIHGSPGSWEAFSQYLKDSDLLKQYHMVAIDRPGLGYSDYGEAEHLGKQAEIISHLLYRLKHKKPIFLVGHSLGGPVVVDLASSNPGLVDGLVLLAGSVDPKEEKSERWRAVIAYSPLRYLVPAFLRPSNDELMYFKKDVKRMPCLLHRVTCRVVILHGNRDSLVPYGNALYAKQNFTNASSVELITLKGADHFIPWSNYQDIKKVLLKLNN